jgi:hypothetical protein
LLERRVEGFPRRNDHRRTKPFATGEQAPANRAVQSHWLVRFTRYNSIEFGIYRRTCGSKELNKVAGGVNHERHWTVRFRKRLRIGDCQRPQVDESPAGHDYRE